VKYGYFVQGQPLIDPLVRLNYVDKIEELVKRDPKEIETMRNKMMKYARTRFNWDRIVDQLEALAK